MPPKKPASAAAAASEPAAFVDEDYAKLIDDLKSEYGTRFEAHGVRVDQLEASLMKAKSDIIALEKALEVKEREVTTIKQRANDQEQYIRSWSIRVLDLPIPQGQDASDNNIVMKAVYNQVLLPIFRGAAQRGLLTGIPAWDQVLETAHILPSKPGQTPPIIARFYSRNIKALVFRLKRDFATRVADPDPAQPRTRRPAKPAHPFYEDLTTTNFLKMRAIANDPRVMACWSVAGQLRFRLNNEERVHKVSNVYDTTDNIISSSTSTSTSTTITGPSTRTSTGNSRNSTSNSRNSNTASTITIT